MLTKDDLQQIGSLLDEKLEQKLEEKLEEKLEQKLEEKLEPMREDIASLKDDVRDIKKTLDTTIRFFDHTTSDHGRRIKRVEKHLALPPLE